MKDFSVQEEPQILHSRDVSTCFGDQVERLRDEGVQLKILQTALTLMQSPLLAEDEVSVTAGRCFQSMSTLIDAILHGVFEAMFVGAGCCGRCAGHLLSPFC
jgi:hypothetical protein